MNAGYAIGGTLIGLLLPCRVAPMVLWLLLRLGWVGYRPWVSLLGILAGLPGAGFTLMLLALTLFAPSPFWAIFAFARMASGRGIPLDLLNN